MMREGVYVTNGARGGLVDERALQAAINEGRVAGAALAVFEEDPPAADHPLAALDEVVSTPHLRASTKEAQEGVAFIVAEQMRDFFLTGAVRGAVNVPAVGAQELKTLEPYLWLAERLGRFQAQLGDEPVRGVEIEYAGEAADFDTSPLTRSVLAGRFRKMNPRRDPANAPGIAEGRR